MLFFTSRMKTALFLLPKPLEDGDTMYKIGELSKLCQLSVKTLRFYDREGLLVPDEIDRFTGYRYYSASRLVDCNRIIALKELGFSLDDIKRQMAESKPEDLLLSIDAKCTELETAVKSIESKLEKLQHLRRIVAEGGNRMFDILIKTMDVMKIAFIRKIYPSKAEAYREFARVKKQIPQELLGNRSVIVNNETEYKTSDFDLCVGVEIKGDLPEGTALMTAVPLPSDCAQLICKTTELDSAYKAMIERMDMLNYQITGAFTEIYYDTSTVELKVPVCKLHDEERYGDDKINLPFENDTNVIGKWRFIDKVPSAEQFCIEKPKYSETDHIWLKELYFLPAGKGYWIMDSWTRGSFVTSFGYPKHTYRQYYTLHTQNGRNLMFVKMKDDFHYISRGGMPEIYVFEKVSDKEYSKEDIKIRDNTDLPFIYDSTVVGSWRSCDFVGSPDDFIPGAKAVPDDALFFRSTVFLADGTAVAQYGDREPYNQTWTKGFLLDTRHSIAEAYFVKEIDGNEYLFTEWKSGDYQFGGRKPDWYVFLKSLCNDLAS